MIFNVYEYSGGNIDIIKIGSIKDKELSNLEYFKLSGTIDLPIQPVKKEVEKVEKVVRMQKLSVDNLSGYTLGLSSKVQVAVPQYPLPDDAYDIEVHYKVKE
jgi:hypothetical protein